MNTHFSKTARRIKFHELVDSIGGARGGSSGCRLSISQSGKVSEKWYPAIVQFQTRVDVNGEVRGLCYLYVHTLKRKASENILFMFQDFGVIEVEFVAC